jgi:hypothetical protein
MYYSEACQVLPPPLTRPQIRTARASSVWSGEDLAQHSSGSITTIRRTGLMPSATAPTCVNDAAIRRALEQAGSNLSMLIKAGRGVPLRTLPAER